MAAKYKILVRPTCCHDTSYLPPGLRPAQPQSILHEGRNGTDLSRHGFHVAPGHGSHDYFLKPDRHLHLSFLLSALVQEIALFESPSTPIASSVRHVIDRLFVCRLWHNEGTAYTGSSRFAQRPWRTHWTATPSKRCHCSSACTAGVTQSSSGNFATGLWRTRQKSARGRQVAWQSSPTSTP